MNLTSYLKDNILIIIPSNIRRKLIKYLNGQKEMYNITVLNFNELKKRLFFDYDKNAIYYLYKNYNLSLNNAKEYLDNLYNILDEDIANPKLNELQKIKNELFENNLLYKDDYFLNNIKNKEIIFFGFDYLTKYQNEIINILKKYTKVSTVSKNYSLKSKPDILLFNSLNNEIEYIINDILNKQIPLSNFYLANVNKDNETTLKRICHNYNIHINFNSTKNLYSTIDGQTFLNNLEDIKHALSLVKTPKIKELIINILNEYYFIKDYLDIKDLLEDEFKNTFIPNDKYQDAINVVDLKDNIFENNNYVYLISFNREYIPAIYKDEDLINDSEKPYYLENTIEKNNNEIKVLSDIIKTCPNLTITASIQNLSGSLEISPLKDELLLNVINKNDPVSNYSNKSNCYNLALYLDKYTKFNIKNPNLNDLFYTYPNIEYLKYNNQYQKVNLNDYKFSLSYSKMNSYYECAFKYYLDNVLKLNKYETTFDAYLGSLCHYILSTIYNEDYDFENAKNDFINNNKFDLTPENKVFLAKVLNELKNAITYIKSLSNINKYQDITCEKNIETYIDDIKFVGIIDKIMKYNNNYVLIDYKTGNTNIDLRLANFGLNLQLPTYLFLIKKINPDSHIVGIYLQHILKPKINSELDKNESELYENHLKLNGYSLGNESYLKDFDPTYEQSNYIKSLKLTNSNGFSKSSKVLTDKEFDYLYKLTEKKISECITNIKNANFEINPKIVDNNNLSCKFCPYKSVCFVEEKDYNYLTISKELKLGDDENA